MSFVRHEPCPCGKSSDALARYKDGHAHCFSCDKHFPADAVPEEEEEQLENSKDELKLISMCPSRGDPGRAVAEWAMKHFDVRVGLSQKDGTTVETHFYPYTQKYEETVAYKVRGCADKSFRTTGTWKDVDLFGARQAINAGGKKLFITEGELDAVSLYQAIKLHQRGTDWEHLDPAVVSVGTGSKGAVRDIGRNLALLKRFSEIVLVFDNDDAGREATKEILKLVPEASVVTLEEKDANAMLMKAKGNQLAKAALFSGQKQRPSSIVTIREIMDRALKKPEVGHNWPWPTITRETYGIHTKKIYGLGAGVGMGKTEFNKEVQASLMYESNQRVGIFMFEEDAGRTAKNLAGKKTGKMYHKPDAKYDEEELREALLDLDDKLLIFDHFGVRDWEEVKAALRYMVVGEGIKFVFLDPLTALVSHLSASEANDKLNEIMGDVSGLTHELDFSVFYSSHLNLPDRGPPHELGGEALESQMTGSRAMMKYSHYLMMLQGNKDPALSIEERNTRWLVARKDREFGRVFKVPLYYNEHTGSFREIDINV